MNCNFQEILIKDPISAWGCDTSGNVPPCGVPLRRTCRCTWTSWNPQSLSRPVIGLLYLFTLNDTHTHTYAHTLGRTPLDEWSARHRDLCLTTQHSQQTDIHASVGIRTRSLSNRAASDPFLRPRGHRNRLNFSIHEAYLFIKYVSKPCSHRHNLVTFLTCLYWQASLSYVETFPPVFSFLYHIMYCEYCWWNFKFVQNV